MKTDIYRDNSFPRQMFPKSVCQFTKFCRSLRPIRDFHVICKLATSVGQKC